MPKQQKNKKTKDAKKKVEGQKPVKDLVTTKSDEKIKREQEHSKQLEKDKRVAEIQEHTRLQKKRAQYNDEFKGVFDQQVVKVGKSKVVAHSTQLPNSPFHRFVYYRQHFGEIISKENENINARTEYTSEFNRKFLELASEQQEIKEEESKTDAKRKRENKEILAEAKGNTILGSKDKRQRMTLFATNFTFDATKDDAYALFKQFGDIESMHFGVCIAGVAQYLIYTLNQHAHIVTTFLQSLQRPQEIEANTLTGNRKTPFSDVPTSNPFSKGGTVHIVFSDEKAIQRALAKPDILYTEENKAKEGEKKAYKDARRQIIEFGANSRGIEKYIQQYINVRPNPEIEQDRIDAHMREFDARRQAEDERMEMLRQMPDEDGFIRVLPKRKGRLASATDGSITVKAGSVSKKFEGRDVTKKRKLVNFYRFQEKDEKKQQLEEIRRKFEEDKQKIAKLREQRKFRPF
eukprot:GEZU01018457.1.p1 GENE.GEZU01018457.1~~GEZU01018457.1.p1  ORF type:complete len:470 (-),score=125.26 GEZU01018457.1:143-1528(-)